MATEEQQKAELVLKLIKEAQSIASGQDWPALQAVLQMVTVQAHIIARRAAEATAPELPLNVVRMPRRF
jgi:hypothetical protein